MSTATCRSQPVAAPPAPTAAALAAGGRERIRSSAPSFVDMNDIEAIDDSDASAESDFSDGGARRRGRGRAKRPQRGKSEGSGRARRKARSHQQEWC